MSGDEDVPDTQPTVPKCSTDMADTVDGRYPAPVGMTTIFSSFAIFKPLQMGAWFLPPINVICRLTSDVLWKPVFRFGAVSEDLLLEGTVATVPQEVSRGG